MVGVKGVFRGRCCRTAGGSPRDAKRTFDVSRMKKHGNSLLWLHALHQVDKKYGFVSKMETDTISMYNCQQFESVFEIVNTSRDLYFDRSYPSEKHEAWLNGKCVHN
jgi:hypothetical protein